MSYIVIGEDIQTGQEIYVTQEGLYSGTYIVGVQGSGKTSILTTIGLKQIEAGGCVIALDPTTGGDMIRDLVSRMPEDRVKDTFIFALPEFKFPFGLPVFSYTDASNLGFEAKEEAKNHIVTAFEKLWPESKTQVYIKKMLRYIVPVLLDHPKFTLAHVPRFFADEKFRSRVLAGITDTETRTFWAGFNSWSKDQKRDETTPFLNRVDELLGDGFVKYLICQKPLPKSDNDDPYKRRMVNLAQLIKYKKIILIHLPLDQRAYKQASRTIGIFFMMLIYATTFNFGKLPRDKRPTYTVLVDEFAKWAIGSAEEFRDLLSYGRKCGCQLVLSNQYLDQFKEEGMESLKPAVTTASTVISMRTNRDDAKYLASLFEGFKEEFEEQAFEEEPFMEESLVDEQYQVEEEFNKEPSNLYADVLNRLPTHPSSEAKSFYLTWVKKIKGLSSERPTQGESWPNFMYYDKQLATNIKNTGFMRAVKYDPSDVSDFLSQLDSFLYAAQEDEYVSSTYSMGEAFVSALTSHAERELEEQNGKRGLTNATNGVTSSIISQMHKCIGEELHIDSFVSDLQQTAEALIAYPLYSDRDEIERERKEFERNKEHTYERWQSNKEHKREVFQRDQSHKREVWERDQLRKREKWEEEQEELAEEAEFDESDIARILTKLENREGFTKVASAIYRFKTTELPDPVSWQETAQRQNDILTRTKFTYCRGKEEVRKEIEEAFDGDINVTRKDVDDDQQHDIVE